MSLARRTQEDSPGRDHEDLPRAGEG